MHGADHALGIAVVAERAARLAQLLRERRIGDRAVAPEHCVELALAERALAREQQQRDQVENLGLHIDRHTRATDFARIEVDLAVVKAVMRGGGQTNSGTRGLPAEFTSGSGAASAPGRAGIVDNGRVPQRQVTSMSRAGCFGRRARPCRKRSIPASALNDGLVCALFWRARSISSPTRDVAISKHCVKRSPSCIANLIGSSASTRFSAPGACRLRPR